MSAFDTTINVVETSIGVPTEEQLKNGVSPALEVALTIGQSLPFSEGPGQPPIQAAVGKVRFGLNREEAIEFFTKALTAAQSLPAGSNIQIARTLEGVDEAAEKLADIAGKKAS